MLELLKVFNSRTCQLVLGAGAMQVGAGIGSHGQQVAGHASRFLPSTWSCSSSSAVLF